MYKSRIGDGREIIPEGSKAGSPAHILNTEQITIAFSQSLTDKSYTCITVEAYMSSIRPVAEEVIWSFPGLDG